MLQILNVVCGVIVGVAAAHGIVNLSLCCDAVFNDNVQIFCHLRAADPCISSLDSNEVVICILILSGKGTS